MSEAPAPLGWLHLLPTLLYLSKSLCTVHPEPFDENGKASRAITIILEDRLEYPFCEYLKVHAHLLSGAAIDIETMEDMIDTSVETLKIEELDG